jgi:hypothetical protein
MIVLVDHWIGGVHGEPSAAAVNGTAHPSM